MRLVSHLLIAILLVSTCLGLASSLLIIQKVESVSDIAATASFGNLATHVPSQRKTFYANGRYFAFYSDGSNLVYKHSKNAVSGNWSSAITINAFGTTGDFFSVCYNGSRVVYVCTGGSGAYLFRQGNPLSNGTISWDDSEQTIISGLISTGGVSISLDSNGLSYVAYVDVNNGKVDVGKSSVKNGTWVDDAGYPKEFIVSSGSSLLPLTNGKMYLILGRTDYSIKGYLFNGTDWESEDTVSSSVIKYGSGFSSVSEGSNIHLVFLNKTSHDVNYIKYTFGVGWGSEVILDASEASDSYPTISIENSTGSLYVFWEKSNTVYYTSYDGSSWASTTAWETDSIHTSTLSSSYNITSNRIGVMWTNDTTSQVRYKVLYFDTCTPTFQVRDADGNNLARLFDLKGTMGNGTSFDVDTNSSGAYSSTIIKGDFSVNVWWGTHLVRTLKQTVISNTTVNIDTNIESLQSGSYHLLFSLNYTSLTTPKELSESGWEMLGVSATNTIEFKMDNTNWIRNDEPSSFVVGTTQYSKGAGSWSYVSSASSSIFTFDVEFSTQDLSMSWVETPSTPSGSPQGGSSYTPPEEPVITPPPITEVAPPIVAPPGEIMSFGVGTIIFVIAGAIFYGEIIRKRPTTPRRAFKYIPRKAGKPKFRTPKRTRIKFPKQKRIRPKFSKTKTHKLKWERKNEWD